jgi:hypothetical protein
MKWDARVWTVFIWPKIQTSGRILWTWWWTLRSHKIMETSWVAENLSSQEGPWAMELMVEFYLLFSLQVMKVCWLRWPSSFVTISQIQGLYMQILKTHWFKHWQVLCVVQTHSCLLREFHMPGKSVYTTDLLSKILQTIYWILVPWSSGWPSSLKYW